MKHLRNSILFFTLICTIVSIPAIAEGCSFTIEVSAPGAAGFEYAARDRFVAVMEANGCVIAKAEENGIHVALTIDKMKSKKRINPTGLLLAGGLSSLHELGVTVNASLTAKKGNAIFLSEEIVHNNRPHELYSGWVRSRSVKKRAVEGAAEKLALKLVKKIRGADENKDKDENEELIIPPRGNGDFISEDRDVWPILGGGLTGIAIHEMGHTINARLLGHDVEYKGNDSRTFTAGPDVVFSLSLLFAHHLGDEQLLPLLPDVTYDFFPQYEPSGELIYVDENGNRVSNGRRDSALLSYSGILFQNLTNEYLLTRHPNLIDLDKPFLKGMFFINLFLPAFYTVKGYDDPNSDLLLTQQALDVDRWQMNAMVILPVAIDVYRYYHPEKKKLRRYSRIAKLIPLIACLSK